MRCYDVFLEDAEDDYSDELLWFFGDRKKPLNKPRRRRRKK